MGCQQSQPVSDAARTPPTAPLAASVGDSCSDNDMSRKSNGMDALPEPAAPPPTDPRLPLNARQVFKLKKSWKGIKRNMEATGVEMFISLFRKNAELKNLFSGFKDLDVNDDSMRLSQLFEQHGGLVMGVLDEAISHIDNVDYVVDLLQKTGRSHNKFPGFTSDLFWWMEAAFLDAVKLILDARYTEQMAVIYELVIKFIILQLLTGLNSSAQRSM